MIIDEITKTCTFEIYTKYKPVPIPKATLES